MSAGFAMPIVMMSGHAEHRDVVRAMKLGAVDFLQKPLHDILPIVRKILSENIAGADVGGDGLVDFDASMKQARSNFEKQYLIHHLKVNNYNIAKVADIAGLERTTLYRKLKDLGIDK